MIRSICKKLIKLKKKEKKYNLAPQTTTISSDSLPNYQGLHSCLKTTKNPFWRNISIILMPRVIFKLKKNKKIKKKFQKN